MQKVSNPRGILARLGVRFSGIYQDGELVGIDMRQTIIRKFLNRVWDFLIRYGIAADEEPCPHRDFPDYLPHKLGGSA